jgi:NADH-quinone oxidoreductase subunit H
VVGVVFMGLQIMAAVMVYAERKVAAFMQQRYGPYLVGPKGLLQPVADILKLFFKEELRRRRPTPFCFRSRRSFP